MKNKSYKYSFALLLLGLLSGGGSAKADLQVAEPFDNTAGVEIIGQGGGTGFADVWGTEGGDSAQNVVGLGSLPGGTLLVSGNSLNSNAAILTRELTEIPGTAGTQTWVSFLFSAQVPSLSGATGGSIGLSAISSLDHGFWMGMFQSGENMVLGLGSLYDAPMDLSSVVVSPNQTYLLVASIDWNAGETPETIRLFVEPEIGGLPPLPASAAAATSRNISTDAGTNRLTWMGVASLVPEGSVAYDEIRIGTTFADVTPVPEPSVLVLAALGLGLVVRRFARRE